MLLVLSRVEAMLLITRLCYGEQVEKMGLLTGSRLGTDRTVDLDELEVCSQACCCDLREQSAPYWWRTASRTKPRIAAEDKKSLALLTSM